MTAVTKHYGPSPNAFVILPLVSALFVSLVNVAAITLFLSLWTGVVLDRVDIGVRGISLCFLKERRHKMKLSIALGTPLLMAGLLTARADKASAMVCCR
jgi:hypothetical protein